MNPSIPGNISFAFLLTSSDVAPFALFPLGAGIPPPSAAPAEARRGEEKRSRETLLHRGVVEDPGSSPGRPPPFLPSRGPPRPAEESDPAPRRAVKAFRAGGGAVREERSLSMPVACVLRGVDRAVCPRAPPRSPWT